MEAQVVIEPLIKDPTLIFFVVLLIILLAPIVMSKLRIPHIIGMVLAGVLIGEHGLNLLQRDISFEVFGQVGLYYIMFLAGLEMDMESVKKNSKRLLIFGLLTCIVPGRLRSCWAASWLQTHWWPTLSLGATDCNRTPV